MEAEKSTAKEFLQQVRRCDIHINSLLEERAQMEALAAKVTSLPRSLTWKERLTRLWIDLWIKRQKSGLSLKR